MRVWGKRPTFPSFSDPPSSAETYEKIRLPHWVQRSPLLSLLRHGKFRVDPLGIQGPLLTGRLTNKRDVREADEKERK